MDDGRSQMIIEGFIWLSDIVDKIESNYREYYAKRKKDQKK